MGTSNLKRITWMIMNESFRVHVHYVSIFSLASYRTTQLTVYRPTIPNATHQRPLMHFTHPEHPLPKFYFADPPSVANCLLACSLCNFLKKGLLSFFFFSSLFLLLFCSTYAIS